MHRLADEGQVCLDGADITGNLMDYRRHIGFLTSELKLEDYFTPNYLFDYFSKLYGVGEEQAAQRKKELFEKFGIDKFAEVKVADMSTGMKQKISLVISIVHNPDIIIFDEPTTGLHFHDIRKLLEAFDALILRGHSIVIIEHNMDVIKCADYVIDLGPEGGDKGGNLVAAGTPEEVAKCATSYTGQFLQGKLHMK